MHCRKYIKLHAQRDISGHFGIGTRTDDLYHKRQYSDKKDDSDAKPHVPADEIVGFVDIQHPAVQKRTAEERVYQ
ncbi:hypothetical protein SDC9_145166 [bioreactor metagenome]|uniref:Uncharacterized protein n=1 Tax=bioreactor metagenome TaxID=1076179 RepID=A0A645E936_9ZZZZ